MKLSLDILFVAPARYEGGTSTALLAELQAAHRAGIRTGLIAVKAPQEPPSRSIHPDVAALIEEGAVALVDPSLPVEVGLVVIHHPLMMIHRPTRPLQIAVRAVVLVLHHPAIDAKGVEQYELDSVVDNCVAAFGHDVALAPVSNAVRISLPKRLPERSHLIDEDWVNLIDLSHWPSRAPRAPVYPVAIGRHARPDIRKWPDTRWEALLAYPEDATRYRIRILGGGKFLREAYGQVPRNWEEEEFRLDGVSPFLMQLDFYVYFHSTAWSEAFGRTIMEAMATELVVILPHLFESVFGDAAVYCEPKDVKKVIAGFVADPAAYAAQAQRARSFMAERFGLDRFVARLNRLFPWVTAGARAPRIPASAFLTEERILFISTNGIGLGHLTQQLAIADRLPKEFQSIFATMSQGMRVARDAGYLTQFLAYHRYVGADYGMWNKVLAEELFELIAFIRPRVIAYDGSSTFQGVLKPLEAHRDIISVWVRRPMWPEVHARSLPDSNRFDLIVEPGELADDFDHGPTKPFQKQVICVPPVLHIDPASRRPRHQARAALGLGPNDLVVAVQLGSGATYDITDIRRALIDEILTHPETIVLDIRSPIEVAPDKDVRNKNTPNKEALNRDTGDQDVYDHPRVRRLSLFPAFRDSLAFDAAVSAAGYNSFHEQIFGAIPTLFVPNEGHGTDLQLGRALYADLNGLGYCARRGHDRYRLKELVAALLDPTERAEITARCRALPYANGAIQIARALSDHARMLRTDYDVTKVK